MSYGDIAVRAAFDLSCQRLDPRRAQLFRLLPASPGPYISTQAAAALTAQEQAATRRGLEALARAHLIERGSGYGRWQMHYLVRLYAQQLSDANAEADGREQALDRLLGYFLDTADAADDHLRALAGMARPAEFAGRDEALAWLDAERPGLLAAVSVAAGTGRDQIAIRLPLVLARYLNWRRRFDDTVTVTTIGLATARRLGDRPREGAALNSLGSALQGVRRFDEAITACQDAAVIYRETGDRHGEGAALTSLGLALREVRRFDEAITACQDAAVIFRETGDRRREGSALGDLESTRRPGSRLRRHSRRRMDGD
jgi:tetratricopeptide (TPR) repeat protein